jgi:DNA-binding cell septation regulator SpoVG
MTDHSTHVRVLDLRILQSSGNLRAFARIAYDATEISDCRIIQQPGQRAYVAPPQREYEKDGKRQWAPIVKWERPLADAITTAVLVAYEQAKEAA